MLVDRSHVHICPLLNMITESKELNFMFLVVYNDTCILHLPVVEKQEHWSYDVTKVTDIFQAVYKTLE